MTSPDYTRLNENGFQFFDHRNFFFFFSQLASVTRSAPGTRCATRPPDSARVTAVTEISRAANATTDTSNFPRALVIIKIFLKSVRPHACERRVIITTVLCRLQLRLGRLVAGGVRQNERAVFVQRRLRRAQVRQVFARVQRVPRLQTVRLFGAGKRHGRLRPAGQVSLSDEFRRQDVRTVQSRILSVPRVQMYVNDDTIAAFFGSRINIARVELSFQSATVTPKDPSGCRAITRENASVNPISRGPGAISAKRAYTISRYVKVKRRSFSIALLKCRVSPREFSEFKRVYFLKPVRTERDDKI